MHPTPPSAYQLEAPYQPTGDQPKAIAELLAGIERGEKYQTLLGATGTGKTFTLSNVIARAGMPTLVMSHNKTLAAQLYGELKQFFPNNAVEFFISYYDYYQPEAYIVHSDTYIEKDLAINEQIDRLRLRATSALVSGRKDVIVVASVSCIYGLGNPSEFKSQLVQVRPSQEIARKGLLKQLIDIFYARNDADFKPGTFRVRGDVVDVFPAYLEDEAYRITFWGDEVERIDRIDPLTGQSEETLDFLTIYPAKIFVTPKERVDEAIKGIEDELRWRLAILRDDGRMLEAQRLEQRTMFDHRELQSTFIRTPTRPAPLLLVRLLPKGVHPGRRRKSCHPPASTGDVQWR
jgi:excinuclease ABC subunit B